jgi:hypothetical protein
MRPGRCYIAELAVDFTLDLRKIMAAALATLIPVTKFETEKALALVQLGFPAVEPVMPQILEWLQDLNWPVGHIFQPFLASIGEPLAPYVRTILAGDDDGWKYSLLRVIVVNRLSSQVRFGQNLSVWQGIQALARRRKKWI